MKTTTDARGAVGTYTYDALNRVTHAQFAHAGLNTVAKSLIYDSCTYGKGRLCERDDAVGTTTWTYTAQGRIATRTETDASSPNLASPPPGVGRYVINYGYNSAGQRTSMQLPSGATVNYNYNSAGQVSGLSVTIAGATTSILSNLVYEPFGAAESWTWGNGATVIRSHDTDGNPSVISSTGLHQSFHFDNAQRPSSITDLDNTTLTWGYGFDSLDRLSSANDTAQTLAWTYDANGNRLTQTGTTAHNYTYDSASNHLLLRDVENSNELYDAAGNPQAYNGEGITFDAEGNLFYYGEIIYTNGVRQRISTYSPTASSSDRVVFDDDGHVLGKYAVDLSSYPTLELIAKEETIYLGDTPVAVLIGQANYDSDGNYLSTQQTLYYVHADHLNTPRRLTRPIDNVIVWRWDSDPFGNGFPNGNPDGDSTWITYSPRFPGQIYDLFSGLYYNYFRDYDPATGRYIESDPIGLAGGSYSTYAYAGGSPVNNIDPSGRFVFPVPPPVAAPIALPVAAAVAAFGVGYGIGTLIYNGIEVPLADALQVPYDPNAGGGGHKPPKPPASTTGGCPPEEPRKFSPNKSPKKWANQLQQRGWTPQQIEDAIQNGQSFPAENLINPANGATRYVSPETGQSVVIDNVTGEVIHVGGPGFKY